MELNHTIVWCRDAHASASFLTGLLGLPAAEPLGPMMVVHLDNHVSLDFYEGDSEIAFQHYAFLVSPAEFDQILSRIRTRRIEYWAEPGKARQRIGEIYEHDGDRGFYFEDPDGHLLEVLTRSAG